MKLDEPALIVKGKSFPTTKSTEPEIVSGATFGRIALNESVADLPLPVKYTETGIEVLDKSATVVVCVPNDTENELH